jgi:hypothetical protein
VQKRLHELAELSTGYPFRGKVHHEDEGDVLVLQIRDIDALTGLNLGDGIRLRGQDGKFDRYFLQPGDILFQSRGSRHPVAVLSQPVRGIAALGLHVLRLTSNSVRPEYLSWYLNHPRTQEKLKECARGSQIPFVSKGDLAEFLVPVPPLEIQHRIAEVERLRKQERDLDERLEDLKQQYIDGVTMQVAKSVK